MVDLVARQVPGSRSARTVRWRGAEVSLVVFLAGASGFIGSALADALDAAGARVIAAAHGRVPPGGVRIDYTRDHAAATWRPRLAGADAVVNAVGIFREHGAATFDAVHARAPCALFAAAAELGVARVVQLSALGADTIDAPFLASKRRADQFLAALPVSAAIAQPSLVYGPGGASARLFTALASAPLAPLPPTGAARVQPIHLDDLVAALVALLTTDLWRTGRVALVGPQPLMLREVVGALRTGLGLPPAPMPTLPRGLATLAARAGEMTQAPVSPAALALLAVDNTAPVDATAALLGRPPRPPAAFIAPRDRDAVLARARLDWLLPPARWAVALLWIVSGIVSLAAFPVAESLSWLARAGLTGLAGKLALAGAAVVDVALGIATLAAPSRALWWTQIALMLVYTAVLTVALPAFWAHPFGPVLKNVPLLALLAILLAFEERRWTI
jgi:uncharacterized protein YbjT (DUF2867 family)